jgi:NAD(P)H-hydrate epimerase
VIGGAIGKTGAALLATEACLRTGAGLTSVYLLSEEYTAINSRCPEAMTVAGNEMVKKNLSIFTAVAAGPGMGKDDIALHVISMLLDEFRSPLLFDADAINIIAAREHHDSFRRFETALKFSEENRCVIVLKGHRTLVAAEGKGYFNATGNAGLAKGGSGDVLTGIIAALLAQGYTPTDAARLGVYLHGLAADLALDGQSQESMLGTDLLKCLGRAFKMIAQPA